MFSWFKKKQPKLVEPVLMVTEGVGSTWHYHLSWDNFSTRSFCGQRTMRTSIPTKSWGVKDHLPSNWCQECETLVFMKGIENVPLN